VYSSQGLKAKKRLKSKLEWLLVRNVVDHESVVQKNRIKTLQRHRQTLEQKWWRSLLTRETAELDNGSSIVNKISRISELWKLQRKKDTGSNFCSWYQHA